MNSWRTGWAIGLVASLILACQSNLAKELQSSWNGSPVDAGGEDSHTDAGDTDPDAAANVGDDDDLGDDDVQDDDGPGDDTVGDDDADDDDADDDVPPGRDAATDDDTVGADASTDDDAWDDAGPSDDTAADDDGTADDDLPDAATPEDDDSTADDAASELDECPDDADKTEPGLCGCGVPDVDTDGDGTPDCNDECSDDESKTEPGLCGCGEPDTDTDGDGTPDCEDDCADDPLKTEPEVCGCGQLEDPTDTDADGALDCIDECPDDPQKAEAGECGCGVPDTLDDDGTSLCLNQVNNLAHRYRFDETAGETTVLDAVGTAHGTVINTSSQGNGRLTLAGGSSDQYVDLPTNLLSGLVNVSIEFWVIWTGNSSWQRVFDFGSSSNGPGQQGTSGTSYLFMTPRGQSSAQGGEPQARAAYKLNEESEITLFAMAVMPSNELVHGCVVFSDTDNNLLLYLNGSLVGSVTVTTPLASIDFQNNWLGRSQYQADQEFQGSYEEFRIYATALTAEQVAFSYAAGPEPGFLE